MKEERGMTEENRKLKERREREREGGGGSEAQNPGVIH